MMNLKNLINFKHFLINMTNLKNLGLLALIATTPAIAQTETTQVKAGITPEGIVYMLPKTAARITLRIEKQTYQPGQYAKYAERFLNKRGVKFDPETTYRIIAINATPVGIPDTARCYAIKYNTKTSANNVSLSPDGILLAINATPKPIDEPTPFEPAPKPKPIDPTRYMNSEILQAGSTSKMAELTAQEIFNIRDAKNELNRGEADNMPKDGAQLRLMLHNLDEQDNALTALFEGTTDTDTLEQTITYLPTRETDQELLFRFSTRLGLTDNDDPAGTPYYIKVEDERTAPSYEAPDEKQLRGGKCLYVCTPSRLRLTLFTARRKELITEMPAAQFGHITMLSDALFNKRATTRITLDPTTGAIDKLEGDMPK